MRVTLLPGLLPARGNEPPPWQLDRRRRPQRFGAAASADRNCEGGSDCPLGHPGSIRADAGGMRNPAALDRHPHTAKAYLGQAKEPAFQVVLAGYAEAIRPGSALRPWLCRSVRPSAGVGSTRALGRAAKPASHLLKRLLRNAFDRRRAEV